MAIINRDQDVSEQKHHLGAVVTTTVGASAGAAFPVSQAPFPGFIKAVSVAANSVSGAAIVALDVMRFTAAGATTIAFVGSTLTVLAHGSSAAYQTIGVSSGFPVQAGDVFIINQLFSGGNVSVAKAVVTVVLQASQDIVAMYGSST